MSEEGITPALLPLGLESVLILMLQFSLALFEVVTEVFLPLALRSAWYH